jgi:hypothetical protein
VPENAIRDWLAVFASGVSALFAGLIWWIARKRLRSTFQLRYDNSVPHRDLVQVVLAITNRGDSDICIEAISAKPPLSLVLGAHVDAVRVLPIQETEKIRTAQRVPYEFRIKPDESRAAEVLLKVEGGLAARKNVSISLHILSTFPITRHKRKTLHATLPASIRSEKSR